MKVPRRPPRLATRKALLQGATSSTQKTTLWGSMPSMCSTKTPPACGVSLMSPISTKRLQANCARASCLEKCREPGFFLSLNPYENLVEAVRILRSAVSDVKEDFRVFILSSVYDDDAEEDKTTWIRRYIGEDIPALYTEVAMNKAEFIESMDRRSGLTADDYLLDDYSRNLLDWSEAGGTAIKYRNELNGRGWNGYGFSGPTVYFDQDPEELAHDLLSIMGVIEEGKLSPDEPVSEEIMREEIDRVMSQEPFWQKEGEVWQAELYADYQDTLSFNDLYDIFNSSDPHAEFLDLIAERYADADYEAQDHISSVVRKKIGRRGGAFAADNEGFFISDETDGLPHAVNYISQYVHMLYPFPYRIYIISQTLRQYQLSAL